LEILPEAIDALDQSLHDAAAKHKGTTVADEGKWYARNGQKAYGHRNVYKHMHGEQHSDANSDQCAETIFCKTGNAYAVKQN